MLKPMLTRLQTALGCDDLMQQMVLVKPKTLTSTVRSQGTVNFLVGYSGSENSQAALDIGLWIAHQTRLVNPNRVLVHVVYVVDQTQPETLENADRILWQARCLASEWRGSLNAHLRVGAIAHELNKAAEETEAEVILIGCRTPKHVLVRQLAAQVSCSILGLPH